jgi:hypothetical protein
LSAAESKIEPVSNFSPRLAFGSGLPALGSAEGSGGARFASRSFAAFLFLIVLAAPGCVERELYVKTDPPDALVTVDGREAKREKKGEPAALKYEHYGIRKVVVRAQGRKAEDRLVTLDPPWYQIFPLDFVTDLLVPWTIHDDREETFELKQRDDLNSQGADALLERAHELSVEADKQ